MQWSQKHEVIMHRNMRKASSSEGSTALPPKSLAPTNETARKPAEPDSSEPNHDIQRNKEFSLSHMEDLPVFWNISKPSSSLPQNLCPSPPTQFETQESILSDYYFSVVCPINSCFDSICNPLRSYVGAIMYTCPLIFQCVMAMAAAHLFQKRTEMVNVVLEHRKAAIYILRSEIEMQTSRTTKVVSLLGSILLGMTCVSTPLVDLWFQTDEPLF
jgi:hypothetical protein